MKKIQYSLISIAGQATALVEVSAVPLAAESRAAQARSIMDGNPLIEQVGFINPTKLPYPKFTMMGNELSIVGTLAAGVWFMTRAKESKVSFVTSGLIQLVEVEKKDRQLYLTLPKSIIKFVDKSSCWVELQGIVFLLVYGLRNAKKLKPSKKSWLEKLSQTSPAAGIIFYSKQVIQPVIYVKATRSLVWESACGSGSLALFALTGERLVKQPSGATLQISTQDDKLQVIINYKDVVYDY